MAKNKCIDSLIEVESRAALLTSFCTAVHDASEPNGPAWLTVVWQLVEDLNNDLEKHSDQVRGAQC